MDSIVAVSASIRQVLALVDRVASVDCAVLIEGESGTGKELIAHRIHRKSPRRQQPFIPVNCAGMSGSLFESQFFGHVRGAFTGADQSMLGLVRAADGGTLFMDEVTEIPGHVQSKLLRVLQDGELIPVGATTTYTADTRFIAATNRSLSEEVRLGRFRQDLFYRLNVVRIHVPPLRERRDDILPLLDYFLSKYAERYERDRIPVGGEVRSWLTEYSWPGNVRQLASWVARLYATGLSARALAVALFDGADDAMQDGATVPWTVMSLRAAERRAIQGAMAATERNMQKAADLLQVHRTTLWRKLKQHGLD